MGKNIKQNECIRSIRIIWIMLKHQHETFFSAVAAAFFAEKFFFGTNAFLDIYILEEFICIE